MSIEPSPNSNSASWVTVESNGIVTIYSVDLDPPVVVGHRLSAGEAVDRASGGFYFIRFETPDGRLVDGHTVLDQVGCDLAPEPITTIDVVMLDGSAWQIVLSAPLVTGVIAQPSGNLTIDGGDPVNITVWDGPPHFGRFHLSPTEPAEVLEVHFKNRRAPSGDLETRIRLHHLD